MIRITWRYAELVQYVEPYSYTECLCSKDSSTFCFFCYFVASTAHVNPLSNMHSAPCISSLVVSYQVPYVP
jgi:hypothetical protein